MNDIFLYENIRQMMFSNGGRLIEFRLRKKNSMEFNTIFEGHLFHKKEKIEEIIYKGI